MELFAAECRPNCSLRAKISTDRLGEIMKNNRLVLLLALILASSALLAVPGLGIGIKYKTNGVYTDGSGGQHPWSITDTHTLLWDSAPYVPVGGVFVSKYIAAGATEENYQADVKTLEIIKSKGITDIILKSGGPITSSAPAAWQKMIDYLEANGFTYGVEMDDGPKAPLQGYLISPSRYRLEGPSDETTIICDWPNVDSAIFLIANKIDNTISATGGAYVKDGKVTISLSEPLAAGQTLMIYPHKSFKSAADGGISDIWGGFNEYRDRVLDFFKIIKFGPGLRFFLEPFTSKMDFTGEMANLIPDSQGFRVGLEAYLSKKRVHEGSVNAAWGLNENLNSIETAARLVPLWSQGRGMPYAYDRASAHLYPVDSTVTQMWTDISEYRDTSAQEKMNTISNTLKKQVANVPVIFKNTKYHRIYANPFGMGGFDGLGAEASGTGDTPIIQTAGPAYSLAEECAKTMWFVVSGTQYGEGTKSSVGYPSELTLATSLDYFREVGCKGFFVDSLQAATEDKHNNSLINDPQQIDWLKSFKSKIKPETLAEFKPTVLGYPITPATGASVKRLRPNTWWLPVLKVGKTGYMGDGISAYSIMGGDETYLWSNSGQKVITLKAGPRGLPTVSFPEGASVTKKGADQFTLALSDTPTVIKGVDFNMVFPYETVTAAIEKLAQLIPEADKVGYDVQKARSSLDRAKSVFKDGQPMIAFGIVQDSMKDLLNQLGGDVWLEGEQSPANNFDGSQPMAGASSGMILALNTNDNPPLSPYTALFTFDTQANSSYEIWIAGTPSADSSPVSFCIDDGNWAVVSPADSSLQNYAPGLSWYKISTENLFPAKHTLKLRVDNRRQLDNKYFFAVDAVVFSPRGFKPNGIIRPY